jgi:hypothetical protein
MSPRKIGFAFHRAGRSKATEGEAVPPEAGPRTLGNEGDGGILGLPPG